MPNLQAIEAQTEAPRMSRRWALCKGFLVGFFLGEGIDIYALISIYNHAAAENKKATIPAIDWIILGGIWLTCILASLCYAYKNTNECGEPTSPLQTKNKETEPLLSNATNQSVASPRFLSTQQRTRLISFEAKEETNTSVLV